MPVSEHSRPGANPAQGGTCRTATPNVRWGKHARYALLAWSVCASLYLFTANGIQGNDDDDAHAWRHYEYLVDGFLSGHLYLSRAPAPEMLALPDPYDPTANSKYRMWDASLYHGRYYLYFGPTPAVLLMLPWKVITGTQMPQRIATAIFAGAGLAALTLLLAAVRRKHFTQASPAHLFWSIVFVGHATWIPVLLRRSAVWELPTITAAAGLWWSLYFLWRYHDGGRKRRWAIAAGTVLALALGARPTYLFGATAVVALFAIPLERAAPLSRYVKRLLPAALPLAIGIVGLLIYNFERFGSLFEFGQHYQLWGSDERNVAHFSVTNIPFNLWLYLFAVPQFGPFFPFVRSVVTDLPKGYIDIEEMHGVVFALPALLLGLAAWRQFRTRRASEPEYGALKAVLLAGTIASLLAAGVLFCFAGGCSRYIVELVAGWSIVAGIGFLAFFERSVPRTALRLAGVAAVVWSMSYVWLASFSFRDFARTSQPKLYYAIAHTLNYPSYWVAQMEHHQFGPILLKVRLSPTLTTGSSVLVADGRPGEVVQLEIERFGQHHAILRLRTNHLLMIETPMLELPDSFQVQCDAPWLYPPAEHPYWANFPDHGERRARQLLFAITINDYQYRRLSIWTFDSSRFDPVVQTAAMGLNGTAWVEDWQRVPVTPLPPVSANPAAPARPRS